MYVYIHRLFGDFQAKNTVCTQYIYGSSQPYYLCLELVGLGRAVGFEKFAVVSTQ